MKLSAVVPWGRSLAEYRAMFALTEEDLEASILGCGDGPASFNAELSAAGGRVMSVDPIYCFSAGEIRERIRQVYPLILAQLARTADQYIWANFRNPGHVGSSRMSAMNQFLTDYSSGLDAGRYVEAGLPELPFFDREFDLALCSHLLFLYSEQLDEEQHIAAMMEMCRVAAEVRVYPLVGLDGKLSPHLPRVIRALAEAGHEPSVERVEYRFQKGATDMLRVRSALPAQGESVDE